jgi:hypothetical protein
VSNPPNMSQEANLFVSFYTDAVEMKAESEKQGRPIFRDVAFVRVIVPGDTNNIIERAADENDKQRFPRAWARFQASEAEAVEGTPLEQWPQITRSLLKECKYFEIHTVEALAGINDSHIAKMGMGFGELRTKAKAWLQAAEGTATVTAQAAENEKLKQMLADMQSQIIDLVEKKAGRPKKETVE